MNIPNRYNNYFYCVKTSTFSTELPDTSHAMDEPDGLLAIGGDLSTRHLLTAYENGIFPWFANNDPILWWSPNERSVLRPQELRVSKTLAKTIKKNLYTISYNKSFEAVITKCATVNGRSGSSWITEKMRIAYIELRRLGYAHSVECWYENNLCGGLYGIALGEVFFGESMFSTKKDASKVALADLCERLVDWGYKIVDCQIHSSHLQTMGAKKIDRKQFEHLLLKHIDQKTSNSAWQTGQIWN